VLAEDLLNTAVSSFANAALIGYIGDNIRILNTRSSNNSTN
jgi:hypothetical protein